MTVLILGMLVALVIAGVVVALVAVPAAREGRQVLSPEGEQLVQAAREATVDAVVTVKDKAVDLAERLPVGPSRGDEPAAAGPAAGPAAAGPAAAGPEIDLRDSRRSSSQHRA